MGGYGSGYQWAAKATTDDCLVLSAGKLMQQKCIRPHLRAEGSIDWSDRRTGEKLASVGFRVIARASDGVFRLSYVFGDAEEDISYPVLMSATALPWGSPRWWFICPVSKDGQPCGRRVGKLYLRGRYFGCRHCHELTYRSCQEAHKNDAAIKELAGYLDMPVAAVKLGLKRNVL